MPIGLPASGKSTYFETELKNTGCIRISSDDIRAEVFGDVNDQTHNSEVFTIMRERTVDALKAGKDVYYDATNISAKRRRALFNSHKVIKDAEKIGIVFCTPIEVVKENNLKRKRHVPEDVIMSMAKRFEVPAYSEGFDRIELNKELSYESKKLEEMLEAAKTISHDNPHHTLTIGEHMIKASYYAIEYQYPNDIFRAARYHDIAKPYVKEIVEKNGESIAHFYGHDKMSAYIFLSCLKDRKETDLESIRIAHLISHHMDFFNNINFDKLNERYGTDFSDKLMMLNKCDVNAH